uniref:tRNA-dihydrouridine synthase n=1 Tax=Rhizophora mucronata TaxID=61149 RepID=A0A2P2LEU3_RHIMU
MTMSIGMEKHLQTAKKRKKWTTCCLCLYPFFETGHFNRPLFDFGV